MTYFVLGYKLLSYIGMVYVDPAMNIQVWRGRPQQDALPGHMKHDQLVETTPLYMPSSICCGLSLSNSCHSFDFQLAYS